MSSESSTTSSGVSTIGLLGIALIVLKLTKVIDWSWWWVTSPFWGGIALVIIVVIIAGIIGYYMNKRKEKRFNSMKNGDFNPFQAKHKKRSRFAQRLEEMQKNQKRRQ